MSITTENEVGIIDSTIELFVPKGDWSWFLMHKNQVMLRQTLPLISQAKSTFAYAAQQSNAIIGCHKLVQNRPL